MSYVKIVDGAVAAYPYTAEDLKRDNPNTSFPRNMTPETLAPYGVLPVVAADALPYEHASQRLVLSDKPSLINEEWKLTYTVVDMTQEEIDAAAAELQKSYTDAVQAHLDNTARERNYDGIMSLCTYAASTNARFAAEGQAGVAWRDAVWAACYAILADWQAGTIPTPTVDSLIAGLPQITWPT